MICSRFNNFSSLAHDENGMENKAQSSQQTATNRKKKQPATAMLINLCRSCDYAIMTMIMMATGKSRWNMPITYNVLL